MKSKFKLTTAKMLRAAVIAAIYSTVTIFLGAFSYGPVQVRFAEALTILPVLFPEAVIGVSVGCLISNIFSPLGFMWADTVFGTLATMLAAILTYYIGRLFRLNAYNIKPNNLPGGANNENKPVIKEKKGGVILAALPPVIVNAIVIPFVIFAYIQEDMASIHIFTSNNILLYLLGFTSIFIGQAIAVYGIGVPLYYGLKKSMKIYLNQSAKKKNGDTV